MEYFSDYNDLRNYMKLYVVRMCKIHIWEYIIYRLYSKYITYGFRVYSTLYHPKFVVHSRELRMIARFKGYKPISGGIATITSFYERRDYNPAKFTHDYDLQNLHRNHNLGKSQMTYIMNQWEDTITIYLH